jgi:hypothetical protein
VARHNVHKDSAGRRVSISPKKLMMMNGGKSFWHEESTPDVPVEIRQIFVRPRSADLPGQVQFYDRPRPLTEGQWYLIAGPEASDAPLRIRQWVLVYYCHLRKSQQLNVLRAKGMSH